MMKTVDLFAGCNNVRPLTTIERSYIQTFPKEFRFEGNQSNLEQMLGNAVPVKLAEYVGLCIFEYLKDNRVSPQKHLQLTLF